MKNKFRPIVFVAIASGLVGCSLGSGSAPTTASPSAAPASSAASTAASAGSAAAAPASAAATSPSPVSAGPGVAIEQASAGTVGTPVSGEIATSEQKDFYRYDVTAKLRDLAVVRLENRSSTLKPDFKLYSADRVQLNDNYDGTAGASIERTIAIEPGKSFYVSVLAFNSSTGKYTLSVTPKKAYDAHEPNDDVLSATPTAIGTPIEGNIMDDKDADWFRISGATQKTIHVVFDNQSATLKPEVKIYSATKSQIGDKYDGTGGANLDFSIDVEPGKDFYLQVVPYGNTGKYTLTATEQPGSPASPASPAK